MPETALPAEDTWTDRFRAAKAIMGLAFAADARRTIGSMVLGGVSQLASPLHSLVLGAFTNAVVDRDRRGVMTAALGFAALALGARAAGTAAFRMRMIMREQTVHLLDQRMMRLTSGIPGLEHLERPDHADKVELLRGQRTFLASAPDALIFNIALVLTSVSIAGVLYRLSPWLLVLVPCGIPSVWASARAAKAQQAVQERNAQPLRLMHHLSKAGTMAEYAGEVRVFGLAPELLRRRHELWSAIDRERTRTALRNQALMSGGWLVFAVGYAGAIALMANRAITGDASAGDVVIAVTLAAQVRGALVQTVQMAGWLLDSVKATERYLWLTDQAERSARDLTPASPASAPDRFTDGVRFEGVRFRYPGTDVDVLEGVDLHLPAGASVAIVGDNGAGKSTLVKLLARFYEPTEGRILVDGVPLVDIPVDEWRARLAAGFQDFARPELIAREAVGIGNIDRVDDEPAIVGALGRAVAASITQQLPSGLDTQLGRTFDEGVELSGGQWQKIALGRAMMREDPLLLLLDEPTAALDAEAEHDLFNRYSGAAHQAAARRGGITLLVSHRFSTVRTADVILVIDGKHIAEAGNHDELMARNGLYRELYELQAASYR